MDKWKDNTVLGVLHPTEVKTTILNIDSRFRDITQSSTSTDFLIRLPRVYKNVVTVRLSSIEIPNTWYSFSRNRGETTFKFDSTKLSISDGNYNPLTLATALENSILGGTSSPNVSVDFNLLTGKLSIDNSGTPFTLEFGSDSTCSNVGVSTMYNNGLGYLMGFTSAKYTGNSVYTGEYIVDTLRDNYILLQLPEMEDALESFTYGNNCIKAFAKIIVNVDKNALIYDNGANTLTKRIQFAQPTNISTFRVRLVDSYGYPIDLMADFSFTLELQEVLSTKVYEAYRNNLTGDSV